MVESYSTIENYEFNIHTSNIMQVTATCIADPSQPESGLVENRDLQILQDIYQVK